MPFIVGYFGKNSSQYLQKIQELASHKALKDTLISECDGHSAVFSGISKSAIQQSDSTIPINNGQGGLLIGKLFTQDTYERIHSFNPEYSQKIHADPALLTKNYWGRY